jgi:hypothetical protein
MTVNRKKPDIRELKPRITVFGVGGAGGNAVNNMITAGLVGCNFVVANTDAQALTMSKAVRIIQMGVRTTEGLGAGSRPDVGCAAAEEVTEEIREHQADLPRFISNAATRGPSLRAGTPGAVVRSGMVQAGADRRGTGRPGRARLGSAWPGSAWRGSGRDGPAWLGTARLASHHISSTPASPKPCRS